MRNDYLKELKYLGVTARLKRLSDILSVSIKELYLANDVEIEPSWHLLLLYLQREKESTMTEIADAFRFSQPAITKMITRMVKKGYIDVKKDESDSRKKILKLSAKAKNNMPKFELIWNAGQKTIKEVLKTNSQFLKNLENFELQIYEKSFKERASEKL